MDGRAHVSLNKPGHRPFEQRAGYYPFHDSVLERIRFQTSLETLQNDVIKSLTAEDLDHVFLK